MNWGALGSVAEAVAALAVVASLIYLSNQIRQNTKQSRIAGRQASQSALQATFISQTEPHNAEVIVRGFDSYHQLSKPDQLRFNGQMLIMIFDFQLSITLHTERALPDEGLAAHQRWIVDILSTPGGREWWSSLNIYVASDTRQHIDRLLASGEGSDFRRVLFPGDA